MELWLMESNAFMKSIVASHILTPHSQHFCSIILHVARVVQRLVRTTEPSLIFWLYLVKPKIESVLKDRSRTVCTALAKYRLGDSFRHLLQSLFCG